MSEVDSRSPSPDRGEDVLYECLAEYSRRIDAGESVEPETFRARLGAGFDRFLELIRAKVRIEESLETGVPPVELPMIPHARYRDFRAVGDGGMGIVYWAVDTVLNREVAFKVVRPRREHESEPPPTEPLALTTPPANTPHSRAFATLKQRFLQEAWVTGGMTHPGIVPVYELGETPNGVPYYTMRFVRGKRTFADAIMEAGNRGIEARLALLDPFLRVCDTIRYAHTRGVLHRDLKPQNIALGEFGEVVVLDWGLARFDASQDPTQSLWQERIHEFRSASDVKTVAAALGTPGYMSPEAAGGDVQALDERADVYSLGTILFQLLTGRLPFEFDSYAHVRRQVLKDAPPRADEVDPAVPTELADLCRSALERDRDARLDSVGALAGGVRAWQVRREVQREVEGLLRDAHAALDAGEEAQGEGRLRQVERAIAALDQVGEREPDNPTAVRYRKRAMGLRSRGFAERESATRRRLLVGTGAAFLLLAAVAGFIVAGIVEAKRREAEAANQRTQAALVERSQALDRERRALSAMQEALGEKEKARTQAEEARQRTQEALASAQAERDEKAKALDEVLRLADAKKVQDLIRESDELWPAHPDRAGEMAEWIARAEELLASRPYHASALEELRRRALPYAESGRAADRSAFDGRLGALRELRERRQRVVATLEDDDSELARQMLEYARRELGACEAELVELELQGPRRTDWRFLSAADSWRHDVLSDLLDGLDRLAGANGPEGGVLAEMRDRYELASTLRQRSIDDERENWGRVIQEIAESPRYHGLEIRPQLGIVPLGRDPESGLFEFAHLGSGPVPGRDPQTGRLVLGDAFAIVLVLIPGGTFQMGAQAVDEDGPNYDPQARADESPLRPVTISPFFLSKFETTQAQWAALTHGQYPSGYQVGAASDTDVVTPRYPVEQLSWTECRRWLRRHGLRLPAEGGWEYACRAGTTGPRYSGPDLAALARSANFADEFLHVHASFDTGYTAGVDDGHAAPAPVGSYEPNAFGLHDCLGNVWEWCRDSYQVYVPGPSEDPLLWAPEYPNRVARGASWADPAEVVRAACRMPYPLTATGNALGVRASRALYAP